MDRVLWLKCVQLIVGKDWRGDWKWNDITKEWETGNFCILHVQETVTLILTLISRFYATCEIREN